jgi:citrate lyase subunit beta/citryl-CoA lyase
MTNKTITSFDERSIAALQRVGRAGREEANAMTTSRRARLPLKYLRQQAHLTAPANDAALAEKAISGAFKVAGRLLDRYGITPRLLADKLEISESEISTVLSKVPTPLVLLDLEDGVPPAQVKQARDNTVRLFREAEWGSTLRFFRPPGVSEERCADDIVAILTRAGAGLPPDRFPVDGLVFPKVRHPHEVHWLYGLLGAIEKELGLPDGRVRVIFQLETGWGLHNLAALTAAGIDRLAGIVLGTVDLSADVLLPEVRYRHPVCEWARNVIVTAAGASGVPAIDGMTLDFPIGLPDLNADENRDLVLRRMHENYIDARHSIDMGMAGRWVGHPLQLLATLLAFRSYFSLESMADELAALESFSVAISGDRGAVAGSRGELLDIGTDRHVRSKLRRATAWGLLSADRALELGLITAEESHQ